MTDSQEAVRLYRTRFNGMPTADWITDLEPHRDGGFTPTRPEQKGTITAACANCQEPLVREISAEALATCSVECKYCKQRSVGAKNSRAALAQ